MKLARFEHGDREDWGAICGDGIAPSSEVLPGVAPRTLDDLISDEEVFRQLKDCDVRKPRRAVPLKEVRLLHPIARPSKIVCLGLNYRDHAQEAGKQLPKNPIIFMKGRNALTGPYDSIIYPSITKELDYEGELVVIIGKRGKRIGREEAMDFIAGYMVGDDVSARDVQMRDGQWTRGKPWTPSPRPDRGSRQLTRRGTPRTWWSTPMSMEKEGNMGRQEIWCSEWLKRWNCSVRTSRSRLET